MNLFQLNESDILAFVLVILRIGSFWVSWPVFSGSTVPNPIKILTVLAVSICLFPVLPRSHIHLNFDSPLIYLSIKEVMMGVCMGYLCRLFYFALGMAGQMVGTTIGFAQGSMYNPALGTQSTSIEQFYTILGTLFFLIINGHHYLLGALAQSFELVPIGTVQLHPEVFKHSGMGLMKFFEIAFQMSAPIVATIFFVNFGMGVLGRAVPQLNVLVTSFPVNVLVGLLVMIVCIPLFVEQMHGVAESTTIALFEFLKGF